MSIIASIFGALVAAGALGIFTAGARPRQTLSTEEHIRKQMKYWR